MDLNVRPARLDDVHDLARILVAGWNSTYKNIVSKSFLERLTIEKSVERMKKNVSDLDYFFVLELNNDVIGFSAGGKQRSDEFAEYKGEVYSIYLYEEFQGLGGGNFLFNTMLKSLREEQMDPITVAVLSQNTPAIKFYEKMGGECIGKDQIQIGDDFFEELIYAYK